MAPGALQASPDRSDGGLDPVAVRVEDNALVAAQLAGVGPDLIVPWRRPSLVILYAKGVIDPSSLGLIDAQGRHDANVIVRMPDDQSVFPGHALIAQVHGSDVPLAEALGDIAADYRVIGGHMVTTLAARWQLGAGLQCPGKVV